MAEPLVLRPSAKINLTLEVGPRRDDGYHDVRTWLQSIALVDTLTLTPRPGPFELRTTGADVPADATNLVWRAAQLLWTRIGREGAPEDVEAALDKHIPAGAGLGGGSADAAAALVGLNAIWDGRYTIETLAPLAAELGADVPFFLQGGLALGTGKGEVLAPHADLSTWDVVVVSPSFAVATPAAYRWLDEDRAEGLADVESPTPLDLGGDGGPLALMNHLQAPVARRHVEILAMIDACEQAGALGSAMSGSGSAVFGLFRPGEGLYVVPQIARPGWTVRATRLLNRRDATGLLGLC